MTVLTKPTWEFSMSSLEQISIPFSWLVKIYQKWLLNKALRLSPSLSFPCAMYVSIAEKWKKRSSLAAKLPWSPLCIGYYVSSCGKNRARNQGWRLVEIPTSKEVAQPQAQWNSIVSCNTKSLQFELCRRYSISQSWHGITRAWLWSGSSIKVPIEVP